AAARREGRAAPLGRGDRRLRRHPGDGAARRRPSLARPSAGLRRRPVRRRRHHHPAPDWWARAWRHACAGGGGRAARGCGAGGGGGVRRRVVVSDYKPMAILDLAMIAAAAFAMGFGQFAIVRSLRLAPAAAVAPVQYTMMPWAIVYGVLLFDTVVHPLVLVGAA